MQQQTLYIVPPPCSGLVFIIRLFSLRDQAWSGFFDNFTFLDPGSEYLIEIQTNVFSLLYDSKCDSLSIGKCSLLGRLHTSVIRILVKTCHAKLCSYTLELPVLNHWSLTFAEMKEHTKSCLSNKANIISLSRVQSSGNNVTEISRFTNWL